jgi:hypothetical protein
VFRTATIYVLVAVLLACPYPCLIRAAAELEKPVTECCGADDDCCGFPCCGADKDHSGAPSSCPEGGTCLCHGAVMERPAAPPILDCAIAAFLPLDAAILIREAAGGERGPITVKAACHFASVNSGRAVRALIASLLL